MYADREQAIDALMDGSNDIWPSEEAIETVMFADRRDLQDSFKMLVSWPVMDAEPNIPLEGPEHDASWSSEVETPQPEGDETDGW